MKELVASLVAKADLTEEQAQKVADVRSEHLQEKLPEPIREPVINALSGHNVDWAADAAKGFLSKILG